MKKIIKQLLKEELETYHLFEDEEFDPFGHVGSEEKESDNPEELGIDLTEDCVLGFSNGNYKLDWPYFSLPAGYSCPFATVCKNFPAKWEGPVKGGKFKKPSSWEKNIKPGPEAKFMCYAARAQGQYPSANIRVFKNLNLLKQYKTPEEMADLIVRSMKYHNIDDTDIFRIHEAGDFFSQAYFDAWLEVARRLPGTLFYAYTVSLPYWIARKGSIPRNMKLIASMDENNQKTIFDNDLRYSRMVNDVEEAKELGLSIDVDDSIAWGSDESFALLIHGPQPTGSEAAQALKRNKEAGMYGKEGMMHKAKEKNIQKKNALRDKIKRELRGEQISEAWFKREDWFNISKEDKIVLNLLERLKEEGLPDNAEKNTQYNTESVIFYIKGIRGTVSVMVIRRYSYGSTRHEYNIYINSRELKAGRWAIKRLFKYVWKIVNERDDLSDLKNIEADLIDPDFIKDSFKDLDDQDPLDREDLN